DAQLTTVAKEYVSYGRWDDELRWAPGLCRQPLPGYARPSGSVDGATHGQKLYSIFAKDHDDYPTQSKVGQVVVKESFAAELVTDPSVTFAPSSAMFPDGATDHFYPYATKDGKVYRAGARTGLFVMTKVDAAADTDAGWVYGVVPPDGTVAAAGRLDACMSCHEYAPHDRLF